MYWIRKFLIKTCLLCYSSPNCGKTWKLEVRLQGLISYVSLNNLIFISEDLILLMTTSFDLTLTKIFKVAQLNWQLGCLFLIFVHPFIIDMISDLTLTKIFQVAQLNWDAYIPSFIPPGYDFRSNSTGMAPRHLRISRPNGPWRKKDSRNLRILVSRALDWLPVSVVSKFGQQLSF